MKRDYNIELFRILLMFGICVYHCITQGTSNRAWVANMFQPCVVGFVFISGWYGIRFSVKKILFLYGVAFWAATVFALYSMALTGSSFWAVFRGVIFDAWFLHAYVVLMALAPLVNSSVEEKGWRAAWPLLLVVFGWGFARTLPVVRGYIPTTAGLVYYSGITLAGIYVAARLVRKYDLMQKMSLRVTSGIFFASLIVCSAGAGEYNSPAALLLSLSTFRFFLALKVGNGLSRFIALVSPSMFFVYLVHGHQLFYRMPTGSIRSMEETMGGGGGCR